MGNKSGGYQTEDIIVIEQSIQIISNDLNIPKDIYISYFIIIKRVTLVEYHYIMKGTLHFNISHLQLLIIMYLVLNLQGIDTQSYKF